MTKKDIGGRPREHNRDEIAEKLILWSKKDDSLNLCGFCADNLIAPSKIGMFARECERFRLSLEITKSILADRREKMLSEGKLHLKAYDMNANTYDYFLKEEKREEKQFEADLKSKEQEKAIQLTAEQINQVIEQQSKSNQISI